jgi:hypothetical protein
LKDISQQLKFANSAFAQSVEGEKTRIYTAAVG